MKSKWAVGFVFLLAGQAVAGIKFRVGNQVYWENEYESSCSNSVTRYKYYYIGEVINIMENGTIGVKLLMENGKKTYNSRILYYEENSVTKVVIEAHQHDLIEYIVLENGQRNKARVLGVGPHMITVTKELSASNSENVQTIDLKNNEIEVVRIIDEKQQASCCTIL